MSVVGTRSAYHARPIDDQREENAAPRGPLVTQGRWSCSEYGTVRFVHAAGVILIPYRGLGDAVVLLELLQGRPAI